MRSNSIPAQDSSFDLYDDAQLCGSATSLEERPRAISHSGSFRDSMEEGNKVGNGGRWNWCYFMEVWKEINFIIHSIKIFEEKVNLQV